jgi:pimeloyl-ACP methyl ester carboxylesterase
LNPLYFGDTANALYGVHHPARGATERRAGIVLCYPFAQEYMRAHRAFRQMSLLLSNEGFHTFRFDYTGTGDSSGGPDDISLDAWDRDLGLAIEELIDMTDVAEVWLVGLRLGAVLALNAARRDTVGGVVLWDPIVAGKTQLEDAALEKGTNGTTAQLAIGGVPILPAFRNDLETVDLNRVPVRPKLKTMIAVSADLAPYQNLRERLAADGADVSYTCVPSDGRWSLYDNWGSALIPQALIRSIVNYLKQAAR